jgi:PIN domain nuclease of toxin-antitoxin system
MDFLLDTHSFIWFLNGDKSLPQKLRNIIADPASNCFISIGSIWEIAVKVSIDKLTLHGRFEEIEQFLQVNNIKILPIQFNHTKKLLELPYYHRDPFDRIIIAQAFSENMPVITKDLLFKKYEVKTIW